MQLIRPVGKGSQNKSQGFWFRGIDQIYDAVQPILSECGIYVLPKVLHKEVGSVKVGKDAREWMTVTLTMQYQFCADDGSMVTAEAMGFAMDGADKGYTKAMTQANKYAIVQVFQIPVTGLDDADAHSPGMEGQSAPGTMGSTLDELCAFIDEENSSTGLNKTHKAAKDLLDKKEITTEQFAEIGTRISARRKLI